MRPICETCGSQGCKGLLVTCSKCRIACAHRYCMEKVSLETSVDFVCADCSKRLVQNRLATESIIAAPRIQKSKARVESSDPVPRWKKIPESSKMKSISPEEVRKLSFGGNKSTFKVPRPVSAPSPMGLSKFVCFPRSRSLNSTVVARKTNQILLPLKKVEPPIPRTLQIRSGVIQQSSKAQAGVEGSKSKVGGGVKNLGAKEICRSILSEKKLQLLPYRPALLPTWNYHRDAEENKKLPLGDFSRDEKVISTCSRYFQSRCSTV